MDPDGVERKLAAILSADVVGYSRLMAEDEDETVRRLGAYRTEITNLVGEHRGRVVDFTGDNFLAEFPTATDAVEAAAEIQRVLKARNAAVPAGRAMEFRIGVHLGEVRVEGERIYGDGVNIAARLEGLAEPGGTCISDDVLHQVQRKLELDFDDLGDQTVKNIPDPVHAYRLRERATAPAAGPRRSSSRLVITTGVAAVIALAAAVYWLMRPDASTGPPLTSIAVLPFDDMSPGQDQEYFADGMAEELINALSKVPGLRVAARTSAFAFKGKAEDIRTIGDQLNVGAIVEGSVRKAGDRVRITAQLIRVADGFHIWSDTYDRKLDDVFAIQNEIAQATVAALEIRLASNSPLVRRPTGDLHAYELYLTGRHFWNQRTEEGLRKAITHFEQTLQADPNYALAWAGLADSYAMLHSYGYDLSEGILSKAASAARRALAIDEASGEAHASLGWLLVLEWRWEEAHAQLRRALQLNPGYAFAHDWYADLLTILRRDEEALREYRRALELDPLSFVITRDIGWFYLRIGNFEAAIQRLEKTLELNPDDYRTRHLLSRALAEQGREREAFEVLLGQDIPPRFKADLRKVYEVSGYRGVRRKALEVRIAETKKNCTDDGIYGVEELAYLGEDDRMFECLDEWVSVRGQALLLRDFSLQKYRSDPRFIAILKQMRLEKYWRGKAS